MIARFRKNTKYDGAIYTDPGRKTFAAAGLQAGGVTSQLHPGAAFAAVRALAKGFLPKTVQGDPWQLGGVLVVTPAGETLYRYESRYAGDHPKAAEVFASLPPV
jgi:hypothetical protein